MCAKSDQNELIHLCLIFAMRPLFRSFRASIVLIVSLSFAFPAFASSELDRARQALGSKDFAKAIEIAVELPANMALDAALINARAYLELGKFADASIAAKSAVDLDPTSFDARFLLATALERSGSPNLAAIQFRRAIDLSRNDFERQISVDAISRIGASKAVQLRGSIGLSPSTNFNKATSNEEVELIFGTGSIVSDKPRGALGLSYSVSAENPSFPEYSLGISGILAEETEDGRTTIAVSKRLPTGAGYVDLGLQGSWSGGEYYQNSVSLLSSNQVAEFADSLTYGVEAISFAGGVSELDLSAAARFTLLEADAVTLTADLRAKRHISESVKLASVSGGLSLSGQFDLSVFDAQISGSLNARKWDGVEALFVRARHDQDALISVLVSPKNFSIYGLKPVLRGSSFRRNSNIATYDIISQDFYFGLQVTF